MSAKPINPTPSFYRLSQRVLFDLSRRASCLSTEDLNFKNIDGRIAQEVFDEVDAQYM